jgi:Ser/Thr protein kinase RdoA (MazF antagonist)
MLLEHVPGEDCWTAPAGIIADGVRRFVSAQAEIAALSAGRPAGLRDRRTPVLAEEVHELLDGAAAGELTAEERSAAHALAARWPELEECGLPDTVVHGDFHQGNWRSDGGPPVVVDFADAYYGDPVVDGLRLRDFLPPGERAGAARAWVEAWSARVPGCDPARALAVAEPLAHLAYAVRYQEFLDGIEPDERIYHAGDPAAAVRTALRCAGT